ncbi:hypothetical protein GCM10009828_077620 [Actinoplanes couchii]|uniref:EamA domain-containing protein n=1 Tax=Actinoplanes couchii TaxID=403638 RepID=A0ABQ3XF69_9ACTN|nr:hypothetical protein Aco03nite_055440 [Actinoplanes couchii]
MTLAGIAAVAWGSADFLAGTGTRRLPIVTVLIGSELTGLVLALAYLAGRGGPLPASPRLIVISALAGVLAVPGMGLAYRAMRDGSPAVVAPVAAGASLVPIAWGLLHGDRPGVVSMIGVVAALAGMTCSSWPTVPRPGRTSPPGRPSPPDQHPSPDRFFPPGQPSPPGRFTPAGRPGRAAFWCVGGAALCFGTFFVLLHEAAPSDPYIATAYVRVAGGVIGLVLLAVARRRVRAHVGGGSTWVLPIAVGVLETVADGAFAHAAAGVAVGAAAVVASLYPAVTVSLNAVLFRERMPAVHLCGVVAALVGVVCLAG